MFQTIKHSRIRLLLLIAITSGLVMACSTPSTDNTFKALSPEKALSDSNYQLVEPVDSIMNSIIDNWIYLEKRAVILTISRSRNYLVTFQENCHELRSADKIATTAKNNRLTKFDSILVNSHIGHSKRCFIQAIYRVDKKAG